MSIIIVSFTSVHQMLWTSVIFGVPLGRILSKDLEISEVFTQDMFAPSKIVFLL